MAAKKAVKALAKAQDSKASAVVPVETALQVATESMQVGLRGAADVLSHELAPLELAAVQGKLKGWSDAIEALCKSARDRMLALIKEKGQKETDAGTLRYREGGMVFEARPLKTGLDPKKVEALLRAKGVTHIEQYMTPTISYTMNDATRSLILRDGKMTEAELDTCRYGESYAVQTPKKEA